MSNKERTITSVRHGTCKACGADHDRDVNAAKSLEHYTVSATVSACGEESVSRGSVKQEPHSKDELCSALRKFWRAVGMPSPFPGMDPYLEGYLWPDVH